MANYNVHTHIFTMSNAPVHFLNLYLPGFAADAVDKITNTSAGASIFEKLLGTLGGNGGKRYASFLTIGKSKSQMDVFEDLLKQYDDPNIKFVALTLYMEQCGAGASSSGFEGQLEEILEVKRKYPDRLIIFMGLDPRWKQTDVELCETIKAYFEQKLVINATTSVYPFAGLKMYPSTGFFAYDEKLKKTFEWAADNGVPVISHCYYLGGIYQNDKANLNSSINTPNPYTPLIKRPPGTPVPPPPTRTYITGKNFFKWLLGQNESTNNKNTCSYFLEPAAYEDMFTYFEQRNTPLKLNLAHFGGAEQMAISHGTPLETPKPYETAPYGVKGKNWYDQIKDLMKASPNCTYTDVAYTVFEPKVHDYIFDDLRNPQYGSKIMFGTDYFLTEQEQPEKTTYQTFHDNAIGQPAASGGTLWQQIAGDNIDAFLKSKYYP